MDRRGNSIVCRVVRKDESCEASSEPRWWRNQPCASWGRNRAANAILGGLLLGPSGCPKGDFLNIPSAPKSLFHGRRQRAVTSNYAPVSEVTRCRRCLQLIASQRRHRQNGLAWGRNGPRRLWMPCLLRTHRRSRNGGCDTESQVPSLQVCAASGR
jgi:hypothetical protein